MYKLKRNQRRAIYVLYKLNFDLIVSISDLMRSLGWPKFRYILIHRLFCITYKAIHREFTEYIAQYIIIQSYRIYPVGCVISRSWCNSLHLWPTMNQL